MSEASTKRYGDGRITVSFDSEVCQHAAECVRRLPAVFDVNRRPWIDVDGADAERIAAVIGRCPSGALQYELPAGE